jgi:hypothetical protein
MPATEDCLLPPWAAGRLCPHPIGFALLISKQTFQEQAAFAATRPCVNNGHIRFFIS